MIRMLIVVALSVGSGLLAVPMVVLAQAAPNGRNGAAAKSENDAARKFRDYLDEDWKRWMIEYPEAATGIGFPGQNRRWSDDSPAGIAARRQHLHESVAALKSDSEERCRRRNKLITICTRIYWRRQRRVYSTATIRCRFATSFRKVTGCP